MSKRRQAKDENAREEGKDVTFRREIARNYPYYLMIIPAALIFFLLAYLPLAGIVIAFKDYNVVDGIYGSPWYQPWYGNFMFYFKSVYFRQTTFNTIWINLNYLVFTTLFNVGFAIMLNEITRKRAVKIYQNLMFLPYFFSSIIVAQIVNTIVFSTDFGLANQLIRLFGGAPVAWVNTPEPWVPILVGVKLWQSTGYGVIIYLASIAGIDEQMYEAAELDGAGRWQKIRRITLPMLLPSIIMLSLLSIGSMFFGDFATIYAIIQDNGMLFKYTDIIETYIFRAVRQSFEFSSSTAISLYQSVVGFLLVYGSNKLVKLYDKDYALF